MTADAPVVAICIANYNGEKLLPDCIESVLAQVCDARIEIIVHDDASNDGSLAQLAARYPQARVIASPDNVGFCVANNRMAEIAHGDYLLLLNNDAALLPGALQALLDAVREGGEDAILTLAQHDWETGALVDRGCLLDPFYNPVPNIDPRRVDIAYVIGACLWIPRPLWRELGGFPEWFGSLAEDMYLCCAARLRGVPVRCVDGRYRHRQGASFGGNRVGSGGLQTTYRRRFLSERNKTATMVVCTPTLLVWLLLVVHAALLMAEGLAMTVLRMDAGIWSKIYGPALSYALRAPFVLRQERRDLQGVRRVGLRTYLNVFVRMPHKLRMLYRYGVPKVR